MPQREILVVEDDFAIRRGIVDALQCEGYITSEADNGNDGGELAICGQYDLLLLDLILPGKGGFEILREVRELRPTQSIIILTARGEEADRVRGLHLGADDYVVKPFSVRELLARIEAVLRRAPERPDNVSQIAIPQGSIDLARREVRFPNDVIALSERECELLRYLACHSGRAISREEILARVWRLPAGKIETRTIDMHIARLREKLRDDALPPKLLRTVRGKGYMFGA